jgi:hypothetical protein
MGLAPGVLLAKCSNKMDYPAHQQFCNKSQNNAEAEAELGKMFDEPHLHYCREKYYCVVSQPILVISC